MLKKSPSNSDIAKRVEELGYRVGMLERKIQNKSSLSQIERMKNEDDRVSPLKPSIVRIERDITESKPSLENLVYPELTKWLLEPGERRINQWVKKNISSNEVRQLLFERQKKAESKPEYAGGLKFNDDSHDSIAEGAKKLGDAIFFIFKHLKKNKSSESRTAQVNASNGIKLVEDLASLVSSLVVELKK